MNTAELTRFNTLFEQHVNALILQGKSPRTVEMYSRSLRQVANFFDRCPDNLTSDELKAFFLHVVQTLSWSHVKVDRNAIQSFYRHVLHRPWEWVDIVKPPTQHILQDVLSMDEVSAVINATHKFSYQIYYFATYSMALRLGETLALTIEDIDSQLMRVHLRQAKGNKDRFIPLPLATLAALRTFWLTHRHPHLLFPGGKTPGNHTSEKKLDRGGLQKAIKLAAKEAGISKNVHIHTLRHSLATHLLESGVNLRSIQTLLGHASPVTTAIYTKMTHEAQQNSGLMLNAMIDRLTITWRDAA